MGAGVADSVPPFLRTHRMDTLVELERLLVVVHAPVARGDHQTPLDLVRLNLACPLEEVNGFLVQLRLNVPHAKP